MIDPHVHLRDWNQSKKETLSHGLRVASLCGFSSVFDMPNTDPAITSRALVEKRLNDADFAIKEQNLKINYHLFMGLTSDFSQVREAVETYHDLYPKIVGLKFFASHSTGNMGIINEEEQLSLYENLARLGYEGVVAVHCEKQALFEGQNRPPLSEIQSIKDQIEFSKKANFKGHLHICHISTKEGVDLVNEAKKQGHRISCAATAHHALFNNQDSSLLMYPPLRDKTNQEAIYQSLLNNQIDFIESDHAPHTKEDKQKGARGIVGFKNSLILFEKIKEEKGLDFLKALTCDNINKIFGLNENFTYKGLMDLSWLEREYSVV